MWEIKSELFYISIKRNASNMRMLFDMALKQHISNTHGGCTGQVSPGIPTKQEVLKWI